MTDITNARKLSDEAQKAYNELHFHLERLMASLWTITSQNYTGKLTGDAIDTAITDWNGVINAAPRALRFAKGAALGYTCPVCKAPICSHKENVYGRTFTGEIAK